MADEIVAIKGTSDGLTIALSATEEWQLIIDQLATRIDEKRDFFNGAHVTIVLGERPVPLYEMRSLRAALERRGLTLAVVQSDSATTLESAEALDLRVQMINRIPEIDELSVPIDPEEAGTSGVLIRHTLRSGRSVHSSGHVVVYGDVNPGAKIVAEGDVIIWGKLRGTVHAGSSGDANAIICALDMNPNQLRIANHIAIPPDDKRRDKKPEIAYVADGQIVVEAWG